MIMLSTIVLGCFINIIGYITSVYLISKFDIKFPDKLNFIITLFNKSSKISNIIENILAFIFLLLIIALNIFLIIKR